MEMQETTFLIFCFKKVNFWYGGISLKKQNRIVLGLLDFGVGGLTVMKQLLVKEIPADEIIFFSDKIPFGQDLNYIKNRILTIIKFLLTKGATIIIFACNTATAAAFQEATAEFPNIKFFSIVDAGSLKASQDTQNSKIGVIATSLTVESKIYERKLKKLNKDMNVYQYSLPELAEMIEKFYDKKTLLTYLKNNLVFFNDKNIDTLILGCTHYPIVDKYIKKIMKKINIVDPAEELAKEVDDYLKTSNFSKLTIHKATLSIYAFDRELLYKMSKKVLGHFAKNIDFHDLGKELTV